MKVSSDTKLYAIIGDPIEHSLSPVMQNVAFQHLDLDSVYLAFRVRPQDLEAAIAGMRSLGVLGFNITIPHKVSVMKYLDKVDYQAIEVGAVNTVVNKNGVFVGYNTDGAGALAALREENVELKGRRTVLLGAGGAARALAFSIAPLTESLVILNRTESKAKDLASAIKRFNAAAEGKKLSEATLRSKLADADVLINSTPVGMYPRVGECLVNGSLMHSRMVVFDVVYNPPETRLLREAKKAGAKAVGGLNMLVHQGVLSFKIWTGIEPPVDIMFRAAEEALEGKSD